MGMTRSEIGHIRQRAERTARRELGYHNRRYLQPSKALNQTVSGAILFNVPRKGSYVSVVEDVQGSSGLPSLIS